ncbi:hypothetical protein M441DRAFT_362799 [Trichoderma asperellum CBS 433.97]|uniref:Uncharacterized protein n=1 Tax=Trichoderma asperellum (strain ATCC 204424 / CBS 433.97 / NBRC 101777) TaxID=1042311 RepID=A0A2T3ZDU0_TRIA4|nr:hypothetical protein M441DRAFT_362799 [Trichoderma asperellum CBS 433.97]PTB42976.1 hypothetical protein M441DRAFT_362799 [Trichoderma asperellum CBS 433.97]
MSRRSEVDKTQGTGSIPSLLFYFTSFVPGSGYCCVLAGYWAAGADARVAGQTRGQQTTQRLAETIGALAMNVSRWISGGQSSRCGLKQTREARQRYRQRGQKHARCSDAETQRGPVR